jgi:aspartate kinase
VSLVVMKFGGTSVADAAKIRAAARRAIAAKQAGHQVVMVVSARGKTTDELVALAKEIHFAPPARELDMLLATGEQESVALMAMALHSEGHPAISFTGGQMGIVTDRSHTRARIRDISTERVRHALEAGNIVVVAGFQGIDPEWNITTLGRGGSDTTAVAIAAALGADCCEVYTDVDGVFTADPRLVPAARMVPSISYDEMLELASLGAGVMHSRSIEFAKKYGVPIHVRSSAHDQPGTWIVSDSPVPDVQVVCGVAHVFDEARVTLLGVPDRPGTGEQIFSRIAARNIPVDMIVQNIGSDGRTEVSFTVRREDLDATLAAAQEAVADGSAEAVSHDAGVSKISVVGAGMRSQSGVAARMFAALAEAGINILMITTSEIKISVLVEVTTAEAALRAVHQAFRLHESAPAAQRNRLRQATGASGAHNARDPESESAVDRLSGMEDLLVTEVTLDEAQSRITFQDVPDRPGIAAAVFRAVAEAEVLVDMIVQNISTAGTTNLSFTVPREQVEPALAVARGVSEQIGAGAPLADPQIAKLSVLGIGMRSHTDVAARLFAALAQRGINVALINTSEIRVSVLVGLGRANEALKALRGAFGLGKSAK